MLCKLNIFAQQTTILNHYPDDTTGVGSGSMELISSDEHRIIINYYRKASNDDVSRMTELISSSLSFYIDQSIQSENGKMRLRASSKKIMSDLDEIVSNAVKYYNFKEVKNFKGFSPEIRKVIESLENKRFEDSDFYSKAVDPATTQRMQFYFVQSELNAIKRQLNEEVGYHGTSNLLVFDGSDETIVSKDIRDSLLNGLIYDPNETLEPMEVKLSNTTLSILTTTDQTQLNATASTENSPMTNDALTNRIINMLEANNLKLDAMQNEINELRAEQTRQWQAQQELTNTAMQGQIDELRTMVVELVKVVDGPATASTEGGVITRPFEESIVVNIPEKVSVYFDKNSTQLNLQSQYSLNEVVDILARNPSLTIMITGYADKSGNEMQNLLISQQRANEVKQFLQKSGLSGVRFITRYLGDQSSANENPNDRRVTLEFVPQ